MPEPAPPPVPVHAPDRAAPALTPAAVEAVLADFRAWLSELTALPDAAPEPAAAEPVDLHTLLGQFTAVRHEVNLLTRAARNQQEQTDETIRLLADSLDALRTGQASGARQESAEEAQRPLLKALVDLHDALSLAEREARRVQDVVLPALADEAGPSFDLGDVELPPLEAPRRSLLARLFGAAAVGADELAGWQRRAAEAFAQAARERIEKASADRRQGAERVRSLLGSLLTGYRMGLQRVERALAACGLEAVAAAGESFDPERMEVLEVVADSGRPAGEVVDEVRRGYLWRGRVFRFAQVRVARP